MAKLPLRKAPPPRWWAEYPEFGTPLSSSNFMRHQQPAPFTSNMVPQRLSTLSAVRKQHLLVEFSSLKHACPQGVFMSLTPGDPALWSGVLFIRKGPYAPSILRFQISFPQTYPLLPPLVTFSTDIFHPLITPLTTYMYTTDIQAEGTVSATDEERLPPGGFSLRDLGVEGWFGRGARSRQANLQTPLKRTGFESPGTGMGTGSSVGSPTPAAGGPRSGGSGSAGDVPPWGGKISTYEVLRYIRSAFDEEGVLDRIPLSAAGNPGAWHAWRAHRVKCGVLKLPPVSPAREQKQWHEGLSDEEGSSSSGGGAPEGYSRLAGGAAALSTAAASREPGEWNWEGVWEVRVKKGVEASISEAVLYGKDAGDDLIRFLNLDEKAVTGIRGDIEKSLECVDVQRRGVV